MVEEGRRLEQTLLRRRTDLSCPIVDKPIMCDGVGGPLGLGVEGIALPEVELGGRSERRKHSWKRAAASAALVPAAPVCVWAWKTQHTKGGQSTFGLE